MKKNRFTALALLGSLVAVHANAIVVFDYSNVITGATPGGAAPWATLTIANAGPNKVNMTLTHNASSADGQFITELLLNIDSFTGPYMFDIFSPKITSIGTISNDFPDAGGFFDMQMKFGTSNSNGGANRLKPGESATWSMTGTGLNENSFLADSAGNASYRTMIHMQGLANGQSSKVGVPEPGTMSLVAGLAFMAARRKKSR